MTTRSPHFRASLRVYEPRKARLEVLAGEAGLTPTGFANRALQAVLDDAALALPGALAGIDQALTHLGGIRLNLTQIANDLRAQRVVPSVPVLLVMIEKTREEIAEQCRALADNLAAMRPHRAETV